MRIFLCLSLLLTLSACAQSLHVVYRSQDVEVVDVKSGVKCQKTYSNWDGELWTDFYAEPCSVYVIDQAKPIYLKQQKAQ